MKSILNISQRVLRSTAGLSWVAAILLSSGCAGSHHAMEANGHGENGHGTANHSAQSHGAAANAQDKNVQDDHDKHQHHAPDNGHDAKTLHPSGHGHGGHHHGSLEIPAGQPVPQISLQVEPDSLQGWNLQLDIANFEFAPERVNQASVVTEGHAHLFINGEKITRLYGPWYYIPSLPVGENEIRVELNGNGHESLTLEGQPIEATVKFEVTAP